MNEKYKKLKILHIVMEFQQWNRSRQWSYSALLSLDYGLKALGIDCFTVNTQMLPELKRLCENKAFDQIWLEVVHQEIDKDTFEWLTTLAPVRIGILYESLEYSASDYECFPHLRQRKKNVENKYKYLTHLMAIDENDVLEARKHKLMATWMLSSIPKPLVAKEPNCNCSAPAYFSGAIYGAREQWLKAPELKRILYRNASAEQWTLYPLFYDVLQGGFCLYRNVVKLRNDDYFLKAYRNIWLSLRWKCFSLWLKKLRDGCASVNLPSCVKTYAGRVQEAMASGVPSISWRITNRPNTERLFEEGKEILLYSSDSPEQLAQHIRKLQLDKDFAKRISRNALMNIRSFHTAEQRVSEIIDWTTEGIKPYYDIT